MFLSCHVRISEWIYTVNYECELSVWIIVVWIVYYRSVNYPVWIIVASKFCSSKVGSIYCNKSFDEAPRKCLNLARPDLKVLLNLNLIPLLKLIILSLRIAILLVRVVLVFSVTAFLYIFHPEQYNFSERYVVFWKSIYDCFWSFLLFVFRIMIYGITTNYR